MFESISDSMRVVYISVNDQISLFPEFSEELPWNHFGRKNLGYLVAIMNGATTIWDFDDDNEGIIVLEKMLEIGFKKPCENQETPLLNPYIYFGVEETMCWPRGFPLDSILDSKTFPMMCDTHVQRENIGVIQSAANKQPDVDAIYRLTRESPFDFKSKADKTASVVIPQDVYTPFNAQATLWFQRCFALMFLPTTVHGRVADIWRSYIAQYIMHQIGQELVYTGAWVVQDRNAHEYLKDFAAEEDLYVKSGALVQFLASRGYNQGNSVSQNLFDLYVDLYERDFIEEADIYHISRWLEYF
mmetsp:Transcript_11238/g.12737  ORF Transcript_11238/g.12737 Transcript_11238/m.12737 type:complete len:301 (-) Transcript_11238:100-1002(-)